VDSNVAGGTGQRRNPVDPRYHGKPSAAQLAAAGVAALLALSTYLIGHRRQRILAQRPLPNRISPRREVYLTGSAIIALIVISVLALTV